MGWAFLLIYVTISSVDNILYYLESFFWGKDLGIFFKISSPYTSFIQIIFLLGTIYALCKQYMRELYSAKKELMWKILVMTATGTILVYFMPRH